MSEMRRYEGYLREIDDIEEWCRVNVKRESLEPFKSWEEYLKSHESFEDTYEKVLSLGEKWYSVREKIDTYSEDADHYNMKRIANELHYDCQYLDGCCCFNEALRISYRQMSSTEIIESKYKASLPTEFGNVIVHSLADHQSRDHLVINSRDAGDSETPLIRIHSECLTGDVFHSKRCDCKNQLHKAIERIVEEGGYIFYLRQEGRGIGLENKIGAYQLQQTQGLDTQEANHQLGLPDDCRDYKLVGRWLKKKGYSKVRLMSNNPLKIKALEDEGIEVLREEHLVLFSEEHAGDYLRTKKIKHGHILNLEEKKNGCYETQSLFNEGD